MLSSLLLALSLLAAEPTSTGPAKAECCAYPALPAHGRSLEQLVPLGWSIESQARGALGAESRPAVALVLHGAPADANPDRPDRIPRILAVALQNPDGTYDLALQNHTLIPRLTTADAYEYRLGGETNVDERGFDFHRGALRVRLYAALERGPTAEDDRTYTFRLAEGKFVLIGYDSSVVSYTLESGAWSVDFLTRKISLTRGANCAGREDVTRHCRWRTTWKRLKPGPLLTIEDVGNGLLDFQPQNLWPQDD